MGWTAVIKHDGEVIGRVLIGGCTMTEEEICNIAGIELATTQEDFDGMPENGMYDFDELEIVDEAASEEQETDE